MTYRFLVAALVFSPALALAAASCESVASLTLPNASVTSVATVEPGAFPAPPGRGPNPGAVYKSLPAFCRVAVTLKPSSDSNIRIEVWMPAAGWNGKLQSVGNGAWAGTIGYPAMATALAAGYAAASTDTGHEGNSADFIPGHPEKVIDFAYRAVHEMTVASKAIVAAYYSNAPSTPTGTVVPRVVARRWRKRSDFRTTTTALLREHRRTMSRDYKGARSGLRPSRMARKPVISRRRSIR
jgi:feruloyl esterase